MATIYDLKPRFQAMLRPGVGALARAGVHANHVTLIAAALSLALGLATWITGAPSLFLLLPAWQVLRMALNAIDGMLAREFGQKSALGAYINELADVVADAALYLPFALVAPFAPAWVVVVVLLAALAEMAGALGPMIGAPRRYDGPLGKSDRAVVFGALGLWVGLGWPLPAWTAWLMPLLATLLALTIAIRVRAGLAAGASAR